MQIFYAPDIQGDYYTLDENESKHIIRVLRMAKGDEVRLIDGKGNLFEGVISNPDSKKCIINITGVSLNFEKRSYWLHIAISPLKNQERFEWFVEKSVEIGVDEITPLICSHSERKNVRTDRINNLIVSAMKQSLKSVKTKINDPVLFKDFVYYKRNGILIITHCNELSVRNNITDIYHKGDEAVILIGPEGDFSPAEIKEAGAKGYIPVHLGKSRLRTETAGIAACHSIYFINQ